MAEQISIDLSKQELLMQYATNLLVAASQASSSMEKAVAGYKELSSQGSFQSIYLSENHDGFARYLLKGQDLVTLAEVLYTHVERTYSTMIDMDKLLAVRIANEYYLNHPEVPQETKAYIRTHPQEALEAIKQAYGLDSSGKEAHDGKLP